MKITFFRFDLLNREKANLNELDSPSGEVKLNDVELSELGIKQSEELQKKIGDKQFDLVFCSDLKRAVDSAEISFRGKFLIKVDERLRECN